MDAIGTSDEWNALVAHRRDLEGVHLRRLFADDPARADTMTLDVGGIHVDYSKNLVTRETIGLLAALARRAGVEAWRDAMFRGDPINNTEGRPVLHVALRAPLGSRIEVDGVDVVAEVHDVLDRMSSIADRVRGGRWPGHTGRPIRNVVNLGIGGSDLGPRMAVEALAPFRHPDLTVRFVANIDGSDLLGALAGLDPAETLFIVCSKSFATLETLVNARSARAWLLSGLGVDGESAGEAVARHFVAVSADVERAMAFGIDPANVLAMGDWVGGRFSLGSAVGLSVMIAIGPAGFRELLAGSRMIDEHFCETPVERNLPMVLGLLAIWYRDFWDAQARAVLPYKQELARFPAYLQQLDMESNGKSVDRDGLPVAVPTGPVVWGAPGTNGQHAFFQLLHQGTTVVPCDFIGVARAAHDLEGHHDLLMANLLAQPAALAFGRTVGEVEADGVPADQVPHRVFAGNRPSTVLLLDQLDPYALGALVACYEHAVFTQGIVWGINSFDQWGVELGKVLADRIAPDLADGRPLDPSSHDPSTLALLAHLRSRRVRR